MWGNRHNRNRRSTKETPGESLSPIFSDHVVFLYWSCFLHWLWNQVKVIPCRVKDNVLWRLYFFLKNRKEQTTHEDKEDLKLFERKSTFPSRWLNTLDYLVIKMIMMFPGIILTYTVKTRWIAPRLDSMIRVRRQPLSREGTRSQLGWWH
jgi:hypothetical protein